jgi:photosystem II stability/assembly factor-like uncharacterized protein
MKYTLLILFAFISTEAFSQLQKQIEKYKDDPQARVEYDFLRLRDPAIDEIPECIAQKEFEFASKLPKHNPYGGRSNAAPMYDWQSVGPYNVSGRVQAIAIDILNEDNMLAGAASGGVWRSIDAGQSWVKVTLPNDEQSISAIVQDIRPGKESTWYYSTGELLSTTGRRETSDIRTHSWGNGIYKSTDNGATRNPLLSTLTNSKRTSPVNFVGIWNLALDIKNTSQDIIYAACFGGIMRSSDGGSTWTNVLGGDSARCFNSEIVIGGGGTLYAAIGSAYDGTITPHQGIWRSIDGINWTKISDNTIPKLIRRTRLALSSFNDSILYCLTETPHDWNFADTEFHTTNSLSKFTANNQASRWTHLLVPYDYDPLSYYGSLGGYALVLAVHPDNVNKVFVGGNNLYYSSDGFTSTNFDVIGGYPYNLEPGTLHPDMHCMIFSRKKHSKIFVTHDGGVSSADDYTNSYNNWTTYNNGLSTAQIYHSSLDRGTPGDDFILSGLQDNSTFMTQSADPLTQWEFVSGGDGMTTAIVPGGSIFFGSWQGANIACFYNDGNTISFKGYLSPPSNDSYSTFFTNFIIEPNFGDEFYLAETDHLWMFKDVSIQVPYGSGQYVDPAWQEIESVYTELSSQEAFITTFGFSTNIANKLFFGTNIGKVYEIDSVSTFPILKDITGNAFPKNGFVSGIEVDPKDANHIIIIFSNYHVESLFRTTDGGKTWTAIGGNLEELPDGAGSGPSVRCAKILHTSNGIIYYVGTSVGLYSTTKINGANTMWTQEAPTTIGNLIVESLDARQSDGKVIVSTQGGGVFRNVISSTVRGETSSQKLLSVDQNYPNPFSDQSSVHFHLSEASSLTMELYNALGEKIAIVTSGLYSEGGHNVGLTGKNYPAGNYFIRVLAANEVITKMITIAK